MRIDELARRSGVPRRTIRYYTQQSLLPPPKLAGRVGYYDDAHLERLKLIKDLQDRRYLPLSVIRSVIRRAEEGADLDSMLAPLDLVYHPRSDGDAELSRAQLARRAKVSQDVVDAAERMGLLFPVRHGRTVRYTSDDVMMLAVVAEWCRLDLPEELGHMYRTSLERISREHVAAFNSNVVEPMDWEHLDPAQARERLVAAYRQMTDVSTRLIGLLQRKLLQRAVESAARLESGRTPASSRSSR